MAELKPCPFCGSLSIEIRYYDPFGGYQGNCGVYRVRCLDCGAELSKNTKPRAKDAWNRRAEDA